MKALQHLFRLLRELGRFAKTQKRWWLVPLVILLLLCGLLIVGVSTISPFIYSLF